MLYYAIKLFLSAAIVVVVSELAKRQSVWAGALASLPLVSLLAMVWLYIDTHDAHRVAELSLSIFWLVLPSLLLFLVLPLSLRHGLGFTWSMLLAIVTMLSGYGLMLLGMKHAGMAIS